MGGRIQEVERRVNVAVSLPSHGVIRLSLLLLSIQSELVDKEGGFGFPTTSESLESCADVSQGFEQRPYMANNPSPTTRFLYTGYGAICA
jgi:hypothetical protein